MSFISNTEIRDLYHKGVVLVEGLHSSEFHESVRGSLEAASIKLKVGDIFQEPKRTTNMSSPSSLDFVDLEQGQMAFVLTSESVNLPPDIGGLMFSKSGGLAERGILITNTGHIDPGYNGRLRYAVVNMGNAPFHLKKGDFLVKVMFFKMYKAASPDWKGLHEQPLPPTSYQISLLGKSLAAMHSKVEETARIAAQKEFWTQGLRTLLLTTAASILLATVGTFITINMSLMAVIEERIELQVLKALSQEK